MEFDARTRFCNEQSKKICTRPYNDRQPIFTYRLREKGYSSIIKDGLSKNYLVAVLKGSIRVSCNQWMNREIKEGEIFLLARSWEVYGECLEDTELLTLEFHGITTSCGKNLMKEIINFTANKTNHEFSTLPIMSPLDLFFQQCVFYFKDRHAACSRLNEAKYSELFVCLQSYYTIEELSTLFYPLLSPAYDFHSFINDNYTKVKTVQELIELSSMSKSAFYRKLNNEFGQSLKQLQKSWKDNKILQKAKQHGVTVSDLMQEFEFDSLSAFQVYCKRSFHCSPNVLIENTKKNSRKTTYNNNK